MINILHCFDTLYKEVLLNTTINTLLNEDIKAPNVRLIDETGAQVGIVDIKDALFKAQKAEKDLVLIAPDANPPVCKILDWGKELYRIKKAAKIAKANSTKVEMKEIQLRPVIDDHDLKIKINRAKKFLDEGKKVRFSMRLRGREMAHKELGMEKMTQVVEMLDFAEMEKEPAFTGNMIYMVAAPGKGESSTKSSETETSKWGAPTVDME